MRGEQWRIGLCYLQSPGLSPRYRKTLPDVVSCGSRAVPRQLRAKARDHVPELLLRSCLVPCEEKKKIQEGVMALFSYVAKVGSRPWLPPVPIQFHQQRLGHGLIISCPGARPEHAVAWDKDQQYTWRVEPDVHSGLEGAPCMWFKSTDSQGQRSPSSEPCGHAMPSCCPLLKQPS